MSILSPRRLAQIAIDHPWRVIAAWAVVFVVGLMLSVLVLGSGLTSDVAITSNPESIQAADLIEEHSPDRDPADELIIVRSENLTVQDSEFSTQVRKIADDATASGSVEWVTTYLDEGNEAAVSPDNHSTLISVEVSEPKNTNIAELVDLVQQADGDNGFAVNIFGDHTAARDFDAVASEDLAKGEMQFGLPAAMIVLLIVFGTLVAAAIPLLMAAIAIPVTLGIVALVAQVFELNLFVTNMVVAMGLALGIDYSLFILSRLREELGFRVPKEQAILNVAATATRAVVFSGIAFSLALVGMLIMPDTVLRSLALGAIVVGIVSVSAALTLLPALMFLLGGKVNRLKIPWLGNRVTLSAGREGRFWGRIVRGVMRRPGTCLAVTVVALVALALPVFGLQLGNSGSAALPDSTAARQGLAALEKDFPAGALTPVEIVIDGNPEPGVTHLTSTLEGNPVFATGAMQVETTGGIAIASVPLTVHPSDSEAQDAVRALREEYVPAAFGDEATNVYVGGNPALIHDYLEVSDTWTPIVIAIVLVLSFLLLTFAFRSVVIPATAILVNLLSVGAAYGLLVLVFQEGFAGDPFGFAQVESIDAWVPVFLFSVLFGLSMDYQVFLLSRIKERYAKSGDTDDAIVFGVGTTARLITGAALIIVVVFAGFATGQLPAFQQMGFGIAVALLIDATVIRSVVIPAAMCLLGERNWFFPRWLRWLPAVEIEPPSDS